MMMFNKIVKLCESHGFFRRIIHPRTNMEIYKIEAVGTLLQQNLYTEWFSNVVLNKDFHVFPCSNGFSETFDFAKQICLGTFPFGLTRSTQIKHKLENQFEKQKNGVNFLNYFEEDTILECFVFLPPSDTTHFFHQWQKERRIWWRKFSASPGRYILTDIKDGNNGEQSVDIIAKYPWGEQLIESLKVVNDVKSVATSQLQTKRGKKTVKAQCVVSKIYSSVMLLNTLCDAYDEPSFQDNPRPLLRLHRKLAPYKISFSIPSGPKTVIDQLKDMALYLCRQLRKNQVSSLLLPSSYKNTLDAQWKQYDQMGIPYNVVLNENTLKTGISQLRSRDTTLKEQVHVADLATYVEKLFKNY